MSDEATRSGASVTRRRVTALAGCVAGLAAVIVWWLGVSPGADGTPDRGWSVGDVGRVTESEPSGGAVGTLWSDVVAEVVVEEVGPARFATGDGERPLIGSWSDLQLYRPVRFSVSEYLKTSDESVVGYWAPAWGGERDGFTDYRDPSVGIELGQTGIVMLREAGSGLLSEPWFAYLDDLSGEWSQGGDQHLPRLIVDWYRYENGDAISSMAGESVPTSTLRADIASYLP